MVNETDEMGDESAHPTSRMLVSTRATFFLNSALRTSIPNANPTGSSNETAAAISPLALKTFLVVGFHPEVYGFELSNMSQ